MKPPPRHPPDWEPEATSGPLPPPERPTRSRMGTEQATSDLAVRLAGVTKRFPGVLANDAVDLDVRRGEIHALLGENGAGKSTLMSVLCGLYRPDEGRIAVETDGRLRRVDIRSPRHAIDLGIGMVHQHFKLVGNMTVAENVIIGREGTPFRLDMKRVGSDIAELGGRYQMPVDPDAYIWQLSVGEQQRVEILKVLFRGAHILILDEPTAVLTPQEAAALGTTLRTMVADGKAVIFISHKLAEVMAFADRVTVLHQGRNVATLEVAATTKQQLARLMVGHDLASALDKGERIPAEPVLAITDLHAANDRGRPAINGISLSVRRGEILGIAGVAGNGQRELAEAVTGLRKTVGGIIEVRGVDCTGMNPRQFIEAGVVHVPGDRLGVGLAGNLPVADNLAMKSYRRPPLAFGPFLNRRAMTSAAKVVIDSFNVMTPGPETPARNLSGGNQQKAILGREITAARNFESGAVLVASYPTRGLDVGAVESVHQRLFEERGRGTAVLLISEDLDELLGMADRIAVLHGGKVMGIVEPANTSVEELGMLMAGESKS